MISYSLPLAIVFRFSFYIPAKALQSVSQVYLKVINLYTVNIGQNPIYIGKDIFCFSLVFQELKFVHGCFPSRPYFPQRCTILRTKVFCLA